MASKKYSIQKSQHLFPLCFSRTFSTSNTLRTFITRTFSTGNTFTFVEKHTPKICSEHSEHFRKKMLRIRNVCTEKRTSNQIRIVITRFTLI